MACIAFLVVGMFYLQNGEVVSPKKRIMPSIQLGQDPPSDRGLPQSDSDNRWRHTKSYRTCYLSTKTNRFARTPAHYSVNDTLGLVYQEIPKAASRSIRKTMGAKIFPGPLPERYKKLFKFTCFRDPIDRFVSVFNFIRHKYPKVHCPDHIKDGKCDPAFRLQDANFWASRLLTEGYFEWHVWPQSLSISQEDGSPRDIDYICDTGDLQNAYKDIQPFLKGNSTLLRSDRQSNTFLFKRFKQISRSDLSEDIIQTLCQAYYVDYCCFDISFPEECAGYQERYCRQASLEAPYWVGDGLPEPTSGPLMPPW